MQRSQRGVYLIFVITQQHEEAVSGSSIAEQKRNIQRHQMQK
jgi:hypothetical protein